VICKTHGKFQIFPPAFLNGDGCKICKCELKIANFLDKASKKHNNKYSYIKINPSTYSSNKKIEIICSKHGSFYQIANNHLAGRGCVKCSGKLILDKDSFIKKSNTKHNNKYSYELINYKTTKQKIIIICPIHGKFSQTPHSHMSGDGCTQCSNKISLNNKTFAEKSNIVHKNKYSYEFVDYKSTKQKVIITCPKHGQFLQLPSNHLVGYGCGKCGKGPNISKTEIEWLNSLNINKNFYHKTIKINNKILFLDALDPTTNTVYEFYGDFWHGNPSLYKCNDLNARNKKTFGELYQKTIDREKLIKEAGYVLITIWENDWKNI